MNVKYEFHDSWQPIVNLLYEEPLKTLSEKILPYVSYEPARENIFKVFSMPISEIKVVILGQDPYPTSGNAIGYAFAVPQEKRYPQSLKIIAKEVNNSYPEQFDMGGPEDWHTLKHWVNQGVFLLNTALTVETGKAGSHLKYWESFTQQVISYLSQRSNCVFIFWGRKAQNYKKYVFSSEGRCLEAPHPAAEAYSGGNAGFYGCNHFKKINEILTKQDKDIILW